MEVQFTIEEVEGRKQAMKISLKGGKKIPDKDDKKKKYDDTSYAGKIVWFDSKKSFGFIAPDDEDLEFEGQTLNEKKNLYFTREDLIADEDTNTNHIRDNTDVTSSLYIVEGAEGLYAGKIALPTKTYDEGNTHTGTVKFFDSRKGFGFITADDADISFEGKKLQDGDAHFMRSDIVRNDNGVRFLRNDMKVQFTAYVIENKDGLSAGKIVGEDGNPVERTEEEKKQALKRKANWEKKQKASNKKAKKAGRKSSGKKKSSSKKRFS